MFNTDVRAATFMAAITALVQRLIRVAGRTETLRMQVVFVGHMACAVWNTMFRGGVATTIGTIKLPALGKAVISRKQANVWVGYVIHEVWHIVFTSSKVWQDFCMGTVGNRTPSMLRFLANAIEDARIERSGMELGYADGFKVVGKDLLAHLMVEGGMAVNPNDPKQIPWVFAVGCRGYGVKGERRLLSALDPRVKVILFEAKRRVSAIPATIDPDTGTRESIAIARWVYAELLKLASVPKEPPPQEDPPEDERPPEDDGYPGPKPPLDPDDDDERPEGEYDDFEEPEEGDCEDGEEGEEGGVPGDDDGDGDDDEPGEDGEDGPGGDNEQPPLKVGDKVECPDGTHGVISEIVGDDATVSPL